MRNMKQISSFKDVVMNGLRAENGGCIYVELDQNMREHKTVFNPDYYLFSNLTL
jgi:hypothetical protein